MRMRENWIAISPSKKTVMFSSTAAPLSVPPLQKVYHGLLSLKLAARNSAEAGDLWFAVSEEDMTPSS